MERITLGSGKIYIAEYTGTVPKYSDIKAEANELGHVKGGATLEYSKETYTAEDDLGLATKTIITSEEVTLKTGVITWTGDTLKKLVETARVSEDAATGWRTVKIGGIDNADGKNYAVLFYHTDKEDGDQYVMIVGRNNTGLSLAFAKDSETTIDAEFKAKAMDDEGTLVIYGEQDSSIKQ